jgi:hypothetical protein
MTRLPPSDSSPAPAESDTFTSDRRWLLGQRYIPHRLEKLEKLPRSGLTCYARSGVFSLTVTDKTTLLYPMPGKKPREHLLKSPVDWVSISPFDGYFLLFVQTGFVITRNSGDILECPLPNSSTLSNNVSRTAHHWISTQSEMYFIFGTEFGHVAELAIRYQDWKIPITWLHKMPMPLPVTSLCSISQGSRRFFLICSNHLFLQVLAYLKHST